MTSLISKAPEKAAETVVFYASSPEVEGKTGLFFKGRQAIESSSYTRDEAVQGRLWDASVRAVGAGVSIRTLIHIPQFAIAIFVKSLVERIVIAELLYNSTV
jgi:hypothetical protein